jgi:hypothetical protein
MNPLNVLFSEGTLCTLDGEALAFPPKECGEGWTPCGEHYEHMRQKGKVFYTTYVISGIVIQVRWSKTSTSKEILIWSYLETGNFTPIPTCTDPYGFEWVAEKWEMATKLPHEKERADKEEELDDPYVEQTKQEYEEANEVNQYLTWVEEAAMTPEELGITSVTEAETIAKANEAVQSEFILQALAQAIADERKKPEKEVYLQAYASMRAAREAMDAYKRATEGTSSYDALQMKALDEKVKEAEETCKKAWEAAYL